MDKQFSRILINKNLHKGLRIAGDGGLFSEHEIFRAFSDDSENSTILNHKIGIQTDRQDILEESWLPIPIFSFRPDGFWHEKGEISLRMKDKIIMENARIK